MTDGYRDARTRVLACLQAAGETGMTTWEIIEATHHSRAAGRIWELAKVYDIEHVREAKHTHRWILKGLKRVEQLEMFA